MKTATKNKPTNQKKLNAKISTIDSSFGWDVEETKSQFITLASHQLLTPLSGILWFTEMLLAGDAGPLTMLQRQELNQVYSSGQRMATLVYSLLNVSRIEVGDFPIRPEWIDVKRAAQEVLGKIKTSYLHSKDLRFSESYDAELPKILLDKNILEIILRALFSNAIKYTPINGLIKIKVVKASNNLRIEVRYIPFLLF